MHTQALKFEYLLYFSLLTIVLYCLLTAKQNDSNEPLTSCSKRVMLY